MARPFLAFLPSPEMRIEDAIPAEEAFTRSVYKRSGLADSGLNALAIERRG